MNDLGTTLGINDIFYSNASGVGFSLFSHETKRSGITLPAVFSACELISNSIAELPLNVKTREENKSLIVSGHNLYNIFDKCLMTKYMMIKMLVWDMLLYGNGIAYIVRDGQGNPINLIYCPKDTYNINYNEQKKELYYTIPTIKRGKIEPIDVIHFLKNSDNGIEGKGILFYAKESIDLVIQTEKACKDYFMNGGTAIKGILSTSSPRLTDAQRTSIRSAWKQAYGTNGSGIAVLENGMNYQALSNNSKDSQLLESRLFNIQEICRFFNLNPTLIGDLSHSSYASVEAALLEFVTHTLFPYITLIENELTRKLIKPSEKNLFIDLDEAYIIRSDKQSQASYLKTLKDGGIISTNEARQMLGLNPVDDGDALIIPYTSIEDNKVNNKNKQQDTQDE